MEDVADCLNVMIAAGGTGGHLFPAQALALKLIEKSPQMKITFIGAGLSTNGCFNKELFPYLDIKSETPFKKHPLKILKALIRLTRGTLKSLSFFSRKKPDVIVGFGSFHTFPAILAARLRKVPIVIFESNALPGKVNRFCSRWAKISAIQFSHASKYLRSKSMCVQMPLTKKGTVTPRDARAYFGLEADRFTLLIFGGSQGAQTINCFACGAVHALVQKGVDFQVIHLVGDGKRLDKFHAYYEKMGIPFCVKNFEEKMEYAWTAADVGITRSGSATLAELIEYVVPTILIPYPYGTENHQLKNALFISEEIGGALTLEEKELSGDRLAAHLLEFIEGSQLKEMRKNLFVYKDNSEKQELSSIVLKIL